MMQQSANHLTDEEYRNLYERLHEEHCARGEYFYRDPKTGYIVFTAVKHRNRGYCCKSGCRHCPFGYKKSLN